MPYDKHILLLTPGFPKDETDSSCLPYLQTYFKAVAVAYPNIRFSAISVNYPFEKKTYKCHNITVYACGGKNRKLPFKIWNWQQCFSYFNQINKIQKVDYINSFWLRECAVVGDFLSRFKKLPHCVSMIGQDARASNRYLPFFNFNRFKITCLSEFQANIFEKNTQRKVDKVIPLGLDTNDFANISLSQERTIDILGVGNLGPIKNYQLFVKMIARLKNKFPNIRSCIIGSGNFEMDLKQQIRNLEIEENITLAGHLSRETVLDYMQCSKILLHTSIYESQGYVFLEALFLGMHVVSFEVGIAQNLEQWKVVEDEDAMELALIHLLQKEKKHESIMLYSVEETVATYANIYGI